MVAPPSQYCPSPVNIGLQGYFLVFFVPPFVVGESDGTPPKNVYLLGLLLEAGNPLPEGVPRSADE